LRRERLVGMLMVVDGVDVMMKGGGNVMIEAGGEMTDIETTRDEGRTRAVGVHLEGIEIGIAIENGTVAIVIGRKTAMAVMKGGEDELHEGGSEMICIAG